jgi:septation ring formation regulator EzrA
VKADERFEAIKESLEELEDDIESSQTNFETIKDNLVYAINGLDDVGVNCPDLRLTIEDLDARKEEESNEIIDSYINKISGL